MSSSDELPTSLMDAWTVFTIARLVGVLVGSVIGEERRELVVR